MAFFPLKFIKAHICSKKIILKNIVVFFPVVIFPYSFPYFSHIHIYDGCDLCTERLLTLQIIGIQIRKRRRKAKRKTWLEYRARSAASGSSKRSICSPISDYTMVSLDFLKFVSEFYVDQIIPRSLGPFHTATYCIEMDKTFGACSTAHSPVQSKLNK